MALRAKVLQIKAAKFEAKKLLVHQTIKEQVSALDPLLQDVYSIRRPKPNEYEARRDLVRVFNEIAKEIYANSNDIPVVVEFGSFVMDLFSTTSDLDLSVNFRGDMIPFPRDKKIQTLRKFANKLYAIQSHGHVYGVLPVTSAKVPILKCVDRGTGVECDISVENRDGISKSQIIRIITSIDERFPKLCFLMKTWAKANKINSSKDKTLNSLSIILLVAFHLQTRNPPILPPFSAIFKDGTDPAKVVKSVRNFVNFGKQNGESLAELFVTLLIKLSSVEKLWAKGLCTSTFDASWISRTWGSKVAPISVEDFTDRSQNVARAVGQAEVKKIYKCIDISIRYLFFFMEGQINGVTLTDFLFGKNGGSSNSSCRVIIPNHIAALLPSQANESGRFVNGKRKNRDTLERNVNGKKKKYFVGSSKGQESTAMPTGVWKEVTQQKLSIGGWEEVTQQKLSVGGWETQQHNIGGWETGSADWGGWGKSPKPGAGNWDRTQQTTHETCAGGWGRTQPLISRGWEGAHEAGAREWGQTLPPPISRGWEGTQGTGAREWGRTQPPPISWGSEGTGVGGWGRAQPPISWGSEGTGAGGWGRTQPPVSWGSDGTGAEGWGRTQPPASWGSDGTGVGGWGRTKPSNSQGSEGAGAGGWGQTQPPIPRGWEGTHEAGARGWGRTQPPPISRGWVETSGHDLRRI